MNDQIQLSAEKEQALISSGIMFLRDLTNTYGADAGLAMWDSMAATFGDDLKGKIFFAMLIGKHSATGVFYLYKVDPMYDYVGQIKAVRLVSGLGLKEAKDACDSLRTLGREIKLVCQSGVNNEVARTALLQAGFLLR
tara:strand:+ start:96 stop:509 length:414 start_codon:yes stop_codon:yes gene_type:complete